MKKTNQILSLLTSVFILVAFTTMSAQRTTDPKSGSTSTTTSSGTSTTDDAIPTAMKNLCKHWQDAYNAKDLNTLGTMYTDNVVVVAPDGTKTETTREDVIHNLENDIVIGPDNPENRIIEINYGAATALPDGNVRLQGTFNTTIVDPSTGETTRESGIFDHVATRSSDGTYDLTQTSVTRIAN